MATRGRALLKSWFKRGLYPTAEQFADWIDSFWHREEDLLPVSAVDRLPELLNDKYARTEGEELERAHTQLVADFAEHSARNENEFAGVHDSLDELETEDGRQQGEIDALGTAVEALRQKNAEQDEAEAALQTALDTETTRALLAEEQFEERLDEHTDDRSAHLTDDERAAWNAKLDAADYTAEDVLAKLSTVGGADSGLAADTVDGIHLWTGTEEEYRALETKDENTLYIVR